MNILPELQCGHKHPGSILEVSLTRLLKHLHIQCLIFTF